MRPDGAARSGELAVGRVVDSHRVALVQSRQAAGVPRESVRLKAAARREHEGPAGGGLRGGGICEALPALARIPAVARSPSWRLPSTSITPAMGGRVAAVAVPREDAPCGTAAALQSPHPTAEPD